MARKVLLNEKGVIIPILAVMGVVIFIFLGLLGIDSARVQNETASLRAEANNICYNLLDYLPIQASAASYFAGRVNQFQVVFDTQSKRLLRARLSIPTQATEPAVGGSFYPTSFSSAGQFATESAGIIPYSSTTVGPIDSTVKDLCSSLNPPPRGSLSATDPGCTAGPFCTQLDDLNHGGGTRNRCVFQGDIIGTANDYPSGSAASPNSVRFPNSLMSNVSHAGNTAICELEAEVDSLIPGLASAAFLKRNILARVGYRIPAQGYFDASSTPPTFAFPNDIPAAGLTIAVAPHMTTWTNASFAGSDSRFLFSGYSGTFNNYNPLTPHTIFTGNSGTSINGPDSTTLLNGPLPNPDKDELAIHCTNPAVLVRNSLLSSLIELASRHGQFRNLTEFLLVGTQHRDPPAANQIQPVSNNPTLLVPFGYDLAGQSFQLPFITYYSGSDTIPGGISIPTEFVNARIAKAAVSPTIRDGYVNPLSDLSSSPYQGTSDLDFQALLANQLRICLHLYSGGQASPQAGLYRFPVTMLSNLNFEPPANNPSGYIDAFGPVGATGTPWELVTSNYSGTPRWTPACPWTTMGNPLVSPPSNPPVCADPGNLSTRRLNAAEVAASLGAIEDCPTDAFGPAPSAGIQTCSKQAAFNASVNPVTPLPNRATVDLRPDLVGLLRYLTGESLDLLYPTSNSTPTTLPAIISPGFFKFAAVAPPLDGPPGFNNFSGFTDLRYPFKSSLGIISAGTQTSEYKAPQSATSSPIDVGRSSALVLALHQRINRPNATCGSCAINAGLAVDEYCRIQCLVNNMTTTDIFSANRPRPITVIYIPTTEQDADPVAIGNIITAFNAAPATPLPPNRVIVVAPSVIGNDPSSQFRTYVNAQCSLSPLNPVPNNQCTFSALWRFMLDVGLAQNDPQSVTQLAWAIFRNRLVAKASFF